MLDPELRTLSVVPRWTVIRTLARDTVATHSFFVALYADYIAELLDWPGDRHLLMKFALLHDSEESLTGDVPGPVKTFIMSREGAGWLRRTMETWLPSVSKFRAQFLEFTAASAQEMDIELITKVADKIDALIFILTELRQGNRHLERTADELWASTEKAWDRLWALSSRPDPNWLSLTWADTIKPAILAHNNGGGKGLWEAQT
jgi:5'-deoxynucleotidase YfbR-like HD superfamily hydrolase